MNEDYYNDLEDDSMEMKVTVDHLKWLKERRAVYKQITASDGGGLIGVIDYGVFMEKELKDE